LTSVTQFKTKAYCGESIKFGFLTKNIFSP
jgi:hypothetical protein